MKYSLTTFNTVSLLSIVAFGFLLDFVFQMIVRNKKKLFISELMFFLLLQITYTFLL